MANPKRVKHRVTLGPSNPLFYLFKFKYDSKFYVSFTSTVVVVFFFKPFDPLCPNNTFFEQIRRFFYSSKKVSWHLKYYLDEDLERKLLIEIMSLTSLKTF